MIKSVIWASMLDYPGHVCATLFFGECNFNCEFCHNKNMRKLDNMDFDKEILPKLLERQELVNYVALSGGETAYAPDSQEILDILYEKGFNIGLHTNGTVPEFLEKNINKVKFIGMDIKNNLENYNEICRVEVNIKNIKKSIDFILKSGVEYEFRTTVYPQYVDASSCINIAKYLKEHGATSYVLQQYNKIEGAEVEPYGEEKLANIVKECNNYLNTRLK